MSFENCEKCGCCCRRLIIEISHLDILREPKLLEATELLDGHGKIEYESDWEKEYLLACGETRPCPFLKDNKCEIYPTRPNVCVALEPGNEQCQTARTEETGMALFKDTK